MPSPGCWWPRQPPGRIVKLQPDWLVQRAWSPSAASAPLHLNAVAYGWAPMAGLGIALFVIPRLLKTPLLGARYAFVGAVLWNAALIAGLGSVAAGINDGLEWLEIPWQIGILFAVGGALIGLPLVFTLVNRRVEHLYMCRSGTWAARCSGCRCCSSSPSCRARTIGRAAGGDELVVRPQRAGPVLPRRWRWPRCTTSCPR